MATREEKLKQCKLYKGYGENPYKIEELSKLSLNYPVYRFWYAERDWVELGEMGIDKHCLSHLEAFNLDDDSLRREGKYPEVLAIDQTLRTLLLAHWMRGIDGFKYVRKGFLDICMPNYIAIKAPPR